MEIQVFLDFETMEPFRFSTREEDVSLLLDALAGAGAVASFELLAPDDGDDPLLKGISLCISGDFPSYASAERVMRDEAIVQLGQIGLDWIICRCEAINAEEAL